MVILLAAANKNTGQQVCDKVLIAIAGSGEKLYLEKEDVFSQMQRVQGALVGRPIQNISLTRLEAALERDHWIKDAQIYFDRENNLHVWVKEREPIARVFTTAGDSFYIDSSGQQMPLKQSLTARVPVVTGFPEIKSATAADSLFLQQINQVVNFVSANDFWNAQIGQIDITPERKFELIPVIGNHVIRLGSAEFLQEKMEHLLLFYKKVLRTAGLDKYSVVNVEFKGQVIGVNRGATSKIDSILLQKNIAALLQSSSIQNVSEAMLPDAQNAIKPNATPATSVSTIAAAANSTPQKEVDPVSKRKTSQSHPVYAGAVEKPKPMEKRQPKAVMKKRN